MSRPKRDPATRGMTLVEMVIAMAIVSLMLGAVSSAVVIAARAVERQSPTSFDATSPAIVLDQLLTEASFANRIIESTPNAITFVVPDRTGDLAQDTIRYAWSGTTGDPLTRQLNTNTPESVSGPIAHLNLTYETTTSTESLPGGTQTQTDVTIASFSASPMGLLPIDPTMSASQYVQPTFAPGTISWTITSIDLFLRQGRPSTPTGSIQIELRAPTPAGLPDSEILDATTAREIDLPSAYSWSTHTFSNAPTLAPGEALCIVVSDNAGLVSASFPLGFQSSRRSFAARLSTATPVWTKLGNVSTPYVLRGTTIRQLPDTTITRTFLVRIAAQLAPQRRQIVHGTTPLYNKPELP